MSNSDNTNPTLPYSGGIPWPLFCDGAGWDAKLKAIADFEPRPDDVIVISYPKCGHHWSHEFLHMIVHGTTEMAKDTKAESFLELVSMDQIEALASPRIILTHIPYQFLPKKVLEKRCKIVRISRNPKDLCVSFYHHTCAFKMYNYVAPLSHFVDMFLAGNRDFGCYFKFERDYDAILNVGDRSDHVFHTSFEMLKMEPLESMKRLGAFLGKKRSDEFYREVVEKTSFKKVKERREVDYIDRDLFREGCSVFRKGQVGDWVNHLTKEQSDRIEEMAEKYGLKFIYEI